MLLLECLLDLIRFLLGAALFSFMNVVAWRLPRSMDPLQAKSLNLYFPHASVKIMLSAGDCFTNSV